MKYIKIRMIFCALVIFFPIYLSAQSSASVAIKAQVRGADGNPLEKVQVKSELDDRSTLSNAQGEFSIEATANTILTVSLDGYLTELIPATPNVKEIILKPDSKSSLVQVAYKKVSKDDLMNDVSYINVPELMEHNYMTYSLENMSAFIEGYNGNLWGMNSFLVLVDGIPRDLNNVLPTEIQQISFLKGVAAVALYGSRAAKGVVYITTKRGEVANQTIDVRANIGVHVPKSYPKYLGSAEYMTLYNEARRNDGLDNLYGEDEIYHYSSGKNPYRYPDVDYYSSEYLKKMYARYDLTTEISGGNQKARYYTNIGFNGTDGLLNFGEAIKNSGSNRFNVRGNVDVDLNSFITCNVDATATFYTGKGVNANYWGSASNLRPHRFSPLIPTDMISDDDDASNVYASTTSHLIDGKYLLGGTQLDQTNPFAAIYAGGSNKYNSRQFQFNTGVNIDLNGVLKGLTFKSMLGVDYSSSYSLSYNNEYAVYEAAWNNYAGSDQISSLTKYGNDSRTGVQNTSGSWYRQTVAASGQFDYNRSFNQRHNVSAMLVAAGFQLSETAQYHRTSNANLGIQASYNYDHKYYFDFSGAVVHSAKLPEANRKAFSPTVSLGWRISEEDFLKNSSVIDYLKLTATAGILNTDLDVNEYFLYDGYYTYTDASWYSWRDGGLVHTFDRRRGSNPDMKFPQRKEISIGLEAHLLKRLLTFKGSFFNNAITGNIVQPSMLYPSYFFTYWPNYSDIPYVNYDEDKRLGFDFYLGLNKDIGQTSWNLGVSGTYYTSKALKRAENYEYDYQNRVGKPIDAIWGLQSDGFFRDDSDISESPTHSFGEVKPGDIKYKDQNEDGIIDAQDEVYLGKAGWSGAPFTLGVNLTMKWKNLTFFAIGTGSFGANAMKNNSYFWIQGEDKYSEVVRDRWTEASKDVAKYPRLTTMNGDNNFRSSDFWIYKTDRFNLAKVQLTYQLPKSILNSSFLKDLSVYVSGANLLTISKERKILEMNIGTAPQTRFYNFGITAAF